MNPESQNGAPGSPEVERLDQTILSSLERGHWNERLTDPWLREHASNPTVRLAVISGILVNTATFKYGGDERVLGILGLTDEEFQAPAVRKLAATILTDRLAGKSFRGVQDVEHMVQLGPDFFSTPKTLRLLEHAIANLQPYSNRIEAFTDLAALPVPAEFLLTPGVQTTARTVLTEEILAGNDHAIDLTKRYGAFGLETEFENPVVRERVLESANRCVEMGLYERFRKWADLFGIDNRLIPDYDVLSGYQIMLEKGEFDEARAFARHFPCGEAVLRAEGNDLSAMKGVCALLIAGNIDAAARLAETENISSDLRDEAIGLTAERLFVDGNADTLQRLKKDWDVPDSTFQDGAARAVETLLSIENAPGAWEKAVAAKAFSGLPDDRFEAAVLDGQTRMIGEWLTMRLESNQNSWEFESQRPVDAIIRRILPILLESLGNTHRRLPIDAGFATRMERFNAVAVIRTLFHYGVPDLADAVLREISSIDDETIRGIALEIARTELQGKDGDLHNTTGSLNAFLQGRNIPPLMWEDLRDEATECAKRSLRAYDSKEFVRVTGMNLRAPDAEREAILSETREEVLGGLFNQEMYDGANVELLALYGLTLETVPLKYIPLHYLLDSENTTLRERRKSDPWNGAIAALLKMQGRSANREHDPWVNELSPLVSAATQPWSLLDRESPEDGALLVEYVRTFGMLDLPEISDLFFLLMDEKFENLDAEDKEIIVEAVGRKAERMESKQIINELRMLRFGLQRALLRDEIHPKLTTTIGEEIFMALRGSTQWDREDDDVGAIMDTWRKTIETARAEGRDAEVTVAPGYEEATFAVARAYRSKDGSGSAEDEIENLLVRFKETVVEDDGYGGTHETLVLMPIGVELDRFSHAARLAENVALDSETATRIFQDLSRYFEPTALPDEAAFESLFDRREDRSFVAGMSKALGREDEKRVLWRLSVTHIARIAPKQWVEHLSQTNFKDMETEVRHRAEFIAQYLREHYLNPAQVPSHTGHAPFPEPLRLAIARSWEDIGDGESKDLILTAAARVEAIRARQKIVSRDTVNVTLVPVQGPLRIFAGDIGDACYSSQHDAMARGTFPDVRAMIFVTNRGKGTERMAGSVLLVETRLAESNERVIVLRANNPRQNLVAQLDAPSLVRQTIKEAIATAKRRKIKYVGVVRDDSSQACSNREDVAAYYNKEFQYHIPAGLAIEPGTNFNGYDIWNKTGNHPTVIVWTNDDPEAT